MINEFQKWPSNKDQYDKNFEATFGKLCEACQGRGFHSNYWKKKWIKTACVVCGGDGRVYEQLS